MTLQVTIGFNPETLSALADLSAAIRGAIGGAAPTAKPASTAKQTAAADTGSDDDKGDDAVTIYWGNHTKGVYGIVESEAEFTALKKKDSKLVKLTKTQYDKKLAEQKAAAEEAKKPAAGKVPSEDDLIVAFSTYLPAEGLDEEEKKARRLVVKAIATRFGAKKASEIPAEHRALAINLVQRVNAGKDIDVDDAEFEDFDAEEDDNGI